MEQPRQITVITKDNNVHDFLAVSIVLAIICCCVSIPTLLCTLPAVAFAAAVSEAYINYTACVATHAQTHTHARIHTHTHTRTHTHTHTHITVVTWDLPDMYAQSNRRGIHGLCIPLV